MKWTYALCAAFLFSACPPSDPGGKDAGGKWDSGTLQPVTFGVTVLDPTPNQKQPLAAAVGPNDRVGVAQFARTGTKNDAGFDNYEVRYLEWNAGVVSPVETVRTVQHVEGLSVAFQPNGQPAVAYLGGGNEASSTLWQQSDAVYSTRSASGTWTEVVTTVAGDEAKADPNAAPVSDRGPIVGLHPALAFVGGTTYLAYRDVHDGQFPNQDWQGSDLEVAEGGPGAWTHKVVFAGGFNKQGWGGHIRMVLAEGQPALVSDLIPEGADGVGHKVFFSRRKTDGTWTAAVQVDKALPVAVQSTQLGPELAYDSVLGFAVTFVERAENVLYYSASKDGTAFSLPYPVFQQGTGGWYPSIAVDPVNHEPTIAYYFCAEQAGVAACVAQEDEVRIATLIGDTWREAVVDPEGAYQPKVFFLSTGKRVVVYRTDPGAIRLALEQ